jgi:outer membrane murein-binding lipoprotein Lpp
MTTILTILSAIIGNKTVAALFAAAVGGLGLYVAGGINRAKKEAATRGAERLAARTEADKIDQTVAGMSDAEVLKGQSRWSRPKS